MKKFLMMMVAAVAMVAVSMSTSSCSNDGETVDTFVLTSEIVQEHCQQMFTIRWYHLFLLFRTLAQ